MLCHVISAHLSACMCQLKINGEATIHTQYSRFLTDWVVSDVLLTNYFPLTYHLRVVNSRVKPYSNLLKRIFKDFEHY